jgi:hypothetical protein
MSDYLTKETECTGEVSVFAKPNDFYNPNDPEDQAFTYILREGTSHWNDRCVLIVTHPVTLPIPAGVNLVEKAVQTLHNKIAEKRAELAQDIAKLEEEIAKLTMITYQPSSEE